MVFELMKNGEIKDYERQVLDNNPFVEFIKNSSCQTHISNGYDVRVITISVTTCYIEDILEYINHQLHNKSVKFFIFANDENSVFSSVTYNQNNFKPIRTVRISSIVITPEEKEYILNNIKTLKEITNDSNYQYLLIRR